MVLVAARQHHLARTSHLSPWEGGGFGMFASADLPWARFLRVSIAFDDGSVGFAILPVDADVTRRVSQLQAMPTPARVRALAQRLATETWVPEGYAPFELAGRAAGGAGRPHYRCLGDGEPPPETASLPAPRSIEVEVARRVFDPGGDVLRTESLAGARAEIPPQ